MPSETVSSDSRPWFTVTVTGRLDVQTAGCQPALNAGLDDVLRSRRATHRVQIYYRGGAGVDRLVCVYGGVRGVPVLPVYALPGVWGERAEVYRSLALLSQSDAVVWVGPEEDSPGPSLVALAKAAGVPCRVIRLPDLARDPQGKG